MRPATGDRATDRYLAELVDVATHQLGDRLLGAYAINSVARGDYRPGHSDLDVALVVTATLDGATKHRLADALRHRSLPCPAPRLELVVYRGTVVADPGPAPAFELNLNTGPAIEDRVSFDPADEPAHWFVLDLAAAAEVARALVGPAPAAVFGRVPRSIALDALRSSRAWHAVHDAAAPNRVLNDCRAWLFLVEDRWSTKSEAAAWAIAAGGDAELIGHALALRAGEATSALDPVRVRSFAERVGAALEAAVATASDVSGRPGTAWP